MYFQISLVISSLMHWLSNSGLFNCHIFVDSPAFPLLMFSSFIPLGSKRYFVWFQPFNICGDLFCNLTYSLSYIGYSCPLEKNISFLLLAEANFLHLLDPSGLIVVVAQLLSCVWLFVTSWTEACLASLSFTISWSLLKLMSIGSVMPSNHLTLFCPLLLPSSFPALGSFSMSWVFASGGQSIGASASTSVLPMNIQGWLTLFKSCIFNNF